MRVPNAESALVERVKVAGYLLNTRHRYGASKARFFRSFGFRADEWTALAVALRNHGLHNEVVRVVQTSFGPRYVVHGVLVAPDGRTPNVCTVWQMDHGETAPRLITAYPVGEDT